MIYIIIVGCLSFSGISGYLFYRILKNSSIVGLQSTSWSQVKHKL